MRGYCEHYVSKFGLLFHQQEIILCPTFVLKHNSSLTVTKMWHWSALHLSIFFELSFNYFRKLQKVLNIKFANEKRGLLKWLKNYTINFWIHRGLKMVRVKNEVSLHDIWSHDNFVTMKTEHRKRRRRIWTVESGHFKFLFLFFVFFLDGAATKECTVDIGDLIV